MRQSGVRITPPSRLVDLALAAGVVAGLCAATARLLAGLFAAVLVSVVGQAAGVLVASLL